ncbi:MAG: PD40 domain-containing protein [Spirochaetes bacterium]|nr:PD40 domain-containing protein [Spirochaetota bacterium]
MRVNIPGALLVIVLLAAGGSWHLSSNAQGVTEAERLLQKAILLETVDGNLQAAIDQYKKIVAENGGNRVVAARALLRLAGCYEKLGRNEAQKTYQQLINDYPDQAAEVALARQKLAALAEASREQASGPGFRKITIPGEVSVGAQLSSDGTRLAMVSGGDIWVVKLQGQVAPEIAGVPERLTQGANASWAGLTWSGNGQWIAFNEAKVPTQDIYVLPVSGGALRKVPRAVPLLGGAHWHLGLSPDGSRLAYTTMVEDRMLLQMVSVATGETIMRFATPDAMEPRFSPDNRHVAYVGHRKWPADILGDVRVVRLADRSDFPVTETPTFFRSPAWSPDGSLLAFLAHPDKDDRSVEEVWITSVLEPGKAAGEPTKIKLPRFAQSVAGWTVDNKIGLLSPSPSRNAIYTVPLSGGKATQATPNGDTFQPQWSPDGKSIFFRWRQGDIAFVPAGGGQISVVGRTGEQVGVSLPNGGNHISPDGKRIAWAGRRNKGPGVRLWTVPVAGGEPVQLTMKPDLDSFQPRWSPDGRWIAFSSERSVPGDRKLDENIFIVSSQGGEPRQLTSHTDCFCELLAWSPAGDSIAYACSDAIIRIVPIGGGEPRTVLKADGLRTPGNSIAWTIDGSRLIYSAKGRLWTVSTAGGEPTAITTDLDGDIMQFALSPDGKRIAFNAPSGGDMELWLMEGFLPLAKGK